MSAFPQPLRDLASALEVSRVEYRSIYSAYCTCEPEDKLERMICLELAERKMGTAKVAFDIALEAYMASERK